MSFAAIKRMADAVGKQSQLAFSLWRQGDIKVARKKVDRIVEDCETILEYAKVLQKQMYALAVEKVSRVLISPRAARGICCRYTLPSR
jgi:hypothetical protein